MKGKKWIPKWSIILDMMPGLNLDENLHNWCWNMYFLNQKKKKKKKIGLITLADFKEKVKNRHFSSAFLIKKIDSFSKKMCKKFFLPIHHRSATSNFWKLHTWKSRQKLSTDFVTLKNGNTPTLLGIPKLLVLGHFPSGQLPPWHIWYPPGQFPCGHFPLGHIPPQIYRQSWIDRETDIQTFSAWTQDWLEAGLSGPKLNQSVQAR